MGVPMSAHDLQQHLSANVAALTGRVQAVAELAELIRQDKLPQAPIAAFVVPIGLNGRTEGDAGANAFTQMIDDIYGVILIVRTSGDIGGGKSLPTIDQLIWQVILATCGADDDDAIGVYRFLRGRLIELKAGTIFYQIDFAIQRQIQVTP